MRIGVDYYPEHWDKSVWEQDAAQMAQLGVALVRMGEFAWCRFEPREGVFDFSWLDEVIEIFSRYHIAVVLCTPTNCPPLWLYETYPDAVQTGTDGRKIATGIRGHRCYTNPDFLRLSHRIIHKLTQHYAHNTAVIAWQIDNELESNFCFCKTCTKAYRSWLRGKYGSLEQMNQAYGNNVWSGEYSSWEQVQPPYGTYAEAWRNPAYMLDFYRYASDSVIAYIQFQADIIRKNCPHTKITTNTWFCAHMPDFYQEFSALDFVSYDNYPTTNPKRNAEVCDSHAFHLDLMRGIKRENFWIMEQLSGGMGSWAPMSRTPYPGMIEGYALQAFAHGADTVLHFRWRTAVTGAEMHWHGILDHSNVPGRRFQEFAHLCQTAKTLETLQNSQVISKVAILYAPENEWAFSIQPQTDGMYYLEQLKLFHDGFTRYGVNVDIICQTAKLDGYEIVVAPELYVENPETVQALYGFAEKGGTVILTNRSGVKNPQNNCILEQLPTVYRRLIGAAVEEYDPIGYDTVPVKFHTGETFPCRQWCDCMQLDTAESLAVYDGNFYQGKPAVTRNLYGKGVVYYTGIVGNRAFYHKLVRDVLTETTVPFTEELPDFVEMTTRTGMNQTYRFLFNRSSEAQQFALNGEMISLAPYEMKVDMI